MTNVGQSSSFTIVDDEGLAINYYSQSSYDLYEAEKIMIWVLIAVLWCGIAVFLFLDRYSLLMCVELLISVGMTWIGSMGFTRYLIYFHPLRNLSYVFGYNYEVVGEDGLFANVNYGFLIFLIPIVSFCLCMLVGKVKHSLAPSQ